MSASSLGVMLATPSGVAPSAPLGVTSFVSLDAASVALSGAVHGIVNIDCKKRSEVESATFNFHIKKASAYKVDNDIMKEIHKFPLPFQNLLIREACSVINRLEKGKGMPGLTLLDCHCLFYNQYLLPCKHIFHENMYSNKLLTAKVWKIFQEMFEEKQQKGAENRRVSVVELTKRIRDRYWRVEESGDIRR
ncbi:6937_t:CDS:2, partial [Dentiscutata erythropus]